MRYKYTSYYPRRSKVPIQRRPLVEVTLYQGSRQAKTSALVDSGADYCVFNVAYARLLHIDLASCKTTRMQGVSGVPMNTYTTTLAVAAEGLSTVQVPVMFVDSPGVDALIGQVGFFDQHRVSFDRGADTFEIVAKGSSK